MLFANMFILSFSFLDRCRQKLTFAHLHTIHDQFWTITDYDARRQLAYSLIVKKRFNVEVRKHIYEYHLPDSQNRRVRVCKTLFYQ